MPVRFLGQSANSVNDIKGRFAANSAVMNLAFGPALMDKLAIHVANSTPTPVSRMPVVRVQAAALNYNL